MFCAATRVEGHLTPIAQQHRPIWQQTSLSTKDSQHVRGGTPNLKQKRWTQQRSSPLHEAPMHSGQSAYKLKLQQRHPLMRMRSDLRAETIAATAREEIFDDRGGAAAREGDIIFCAGFDSSPTWTRTVATSQGETAGPRGGEELIEARSGLENSF